MTTILKISRNSAGRNDAVAALRDAGISVVEVEDWDAAAQALSSCDAALVVCDGAILEATDAAALTRAVQAVGRAKQGGEKQTELPRDIARSLSHDLRTPLSAMAGWLHLMESGKLDEEGMKRAIGKLRNNIDDQVRTIDRFLGNTNTARN